MCDERLEWLDRTLSQRPDARTLVMMHHAPFVTGLTHMDEVGMDRSDALEAVILKSVACDPAGRYQSAQELLDALLAVERATARPRVEREAHPWGRALSS